MFGNFVNVCVMQLVSWVAEGGGEGGVGFLNQCCVNGLLGILVDGIYGDALALEEPW